MLWLLLLSACSGSTSSGASVVGADPVPELLVAAGARHSCAARDGSVSCWGANDRGQLGLAEASPPVANPRSIEGLEAIVELEASGDHTCARDRGGAVFCWGALSAESTPVLAPTRVEALAPATRIAVGPSHACALDEQGRAACWGENTLGQLGDGSRNASLVPVSPTTRERFVDLEAGAGVSCAMTSRREWRCWGRRPDEYGAMQSPEAGSDSLRPVSVPRISDRRIAIAESACAATETRVTCQGLAFEGAPIAALALGGPRAGATVCVLREDAKVLCAGRNDDGQAAAGAPVVLDRATEIPELAGARAIALGPRHGCAAFDDGVRCWGANDAGQRGLGVVGEVDSRPRAVRLQGSDPTAQDCLMSEPFVCEIVERETPDRGRGVHVCYCGPETAGLRPPEPVRCFDVDLERGTASPATSADFGERLPDEDPAPVRTDATTITACSAAGRCATIRPPRPRELIQGGDPVAICAGATSDGAYVTVGRVERSTVEYVEEVGEVAAIQLETYETSTGRRIARAPLSAPLRIDLGEEDCAFRATGAMLEVHYQSTVFAIELRDPRTGRLLVDLGPIRARVHAGDDLWVYADELGALRWIREDGTVMATSPAPPPTASVPILEPWPAGIRAGERVAIASAGRVRVFDRAATRLHDVTLPWCRPGSGPR
jgi:hypothetical protein